jgi:hypothetical protein
VALIVPDDGTAAVGEIGTVAVQLAPGASELVHVVEASVKGGRHAEREQRHRDQRGVGDGERAGGLVVPT